MKHLSSLIALLIVVISSAQNAPCYFDEFANNEVAQRTEVTITSQILNNRKLSNEQKRADEIKVIPVVVHVIHDGGNENISDAQIESQILIMNEDFGKLVGSNGEGAGVDTKVRFTLANIDPNGDCTNGIVRVKSKLTNHQTYQRSQLKELSFWDNTKYMNIYLVKSINGGILGYSSFPGGPADEDGMVVRHHVFGNTGTASSSLGRTATHEIGHWFGLYHTFNNGCGDDVCTDGDYVCDTPPQASPSFNCQTINSCSNDSPDVSDQKENYMNYTNDACKNMFTDGQKERIQATLESVRTNIWSKENLLATGVDSSYSPPFFCNLAAHFSTLTPSICVGNSVEFFDVTLNNPDTWMWTFEGGSPATSTEANPIVVYDSIGNFSVKLAVWSDTGSDSVTIDNYITVSAPGTGNSLPYYEDFELGAYPPQDLSIVNYDGGITWELDSAAAYDGSKYSIRINNLINTNYGSSDELIPEYLNFQSVHPDSNIYMSFQWAYAKSDPSFSDEMLVLLSTDCGVTFKRIYYRSQTSLATGPTQSTPFIPSASQWRRAGINLNAYREFTYVQLKIVNVTDGGNNLYIDNIYIGDNENDPVGVSEQLGIANDLKIYPNPSSGSSFLEFTLINAQNIDVKIENAQGIEISISNQGLLKKGKQKIPLDLNALSNGLYFVSVQGITGSVMQRIVVQ